MTERPPKENEKYAGVRVFRRHLPDKINEILIDHQAAKKKQKGVKHYSMERTVYDIILLWHNNCNQVEE